MLLVVAGLLYLSRDDAGQRAQAREQAQELPCGSRGIEYVLEPVRKRLPANCGRSSQERRESAGDHREVHQQTPPPRVDFHVSFNLGMLRSHPAQELAGGHPSCVFVASSHVSSPFVHAAARSPCACHLSSVGGMRRRAGRKQRSDGGTAASGGPSAPHGQPGGERAWMWTNVPPWRF